MMHLVPEETRHPSQGTVRAACLARARVVEVVEEGKDGQVREIVARA